MRDQLPFFQRVQSILSRSNTKVCQGCDLFRQTLPQPGQNAQTCQWVLIHRRHPILGEGRRGNSAVAEIGHTIAKIRNSQIGTGPRDRNRNILYVAQCAPNFQGIPQSRRIHLDPNRSSAVISYNGRCAFLDRSAIIAGRQ